MNTVKERHVKIDLGERSYDIVIGPGLLTQAAPLLEPILGGRRVAVVTDETVADRYLDRLTPLLDTVQCRSGVYKIPRGESAKSFAGVEQLLTSLLEDGYDRKSVVIAFGGGVVGDVAGFAAALLMRGIELVQIPTTLMAQVDSSVGGKNGINTAQGKNLVGSFLQPRIVLNDISMLESLPVDQLKAGYGEVLKCALLCGESELGWLEANIGRLLDHDETTIVNAIAMGCATKAAIVTEDERDRGRRAFVNLGHTFAHAFEAQSGYGSLLHGAAVAVGLIAACDLSERVGSAVPGLADRIRRHLEQADMATDLNGLSATTDWQVEAIQHSMLHDKKTVDGVIHFVLLRGLGKPFVSGEVSSELLEQTLLSLGAT